MRLASLFVAASAIMSAAPAAAQDAATEDAEILKRTPPPPIVRMADEDLPDVCPGTTDLNGPALWKLADADTTIYLFGTIHVLPKGFCWRTDAINAALDASDELVTETDIPKNIFTIAGAFAEAAFDPTQPALRDRLPAEAHPGIDRLVEAIELPESFFDKLDSWAVAMLMWDLEEEIEWGEGTEEQLESQFEDAGKPIGELEDFIFQVELFDRLDKDLQDVMLWSALEDTYGDDASTDEENDEIYDTMFDDWVSGRLVDIRTELEEYDLDFGSIAEEELARRFNEQFLEILLYERNRNWVEWLEARLDTPGTTFVAVGAGHMAGEKSVIDYLEQAGYTVERLQ